MWSRVLEFLGQGYRNRPAAEAARRALESRYPEVEATRVRLRAHEADRDVFAVCYRERQGETFPSCGTPPHKLFAVRTDLTTEELPCELNSPYRLRGIK